MPPLVLFQMQRFLSSEKTASPSGEQLTHVAPVHAHEGDCAVAAGRGGMTERCLQEPREGLPRHLAGPHGELAMAGSDDALPRNPMMALRITYRRRSTIRGSGARTNTPLGSSPKLPPTLAGDSVRP